MNISIALFVGLSGAGKRHLRILKQLLPGDPSFTAFRRNAQQNLNFMQYFLNQIN